MISREALYALAGALEGLPVLGCLNGTVSAQAGIRYGDVLLSVNGKRTRSLGDYVVARGLRSDGMAIVVFRAGQELACELTYDAPGRAPDTAKILAELLEKRVLPMEDEALSSADPRS